MDSVSLYTLCNFAELSWRNSADAHLFFFFFFPPTHPPPSVRPERPLGQTSRRFQCGIRHFAVVLLRCPNGGCFFYPFFSTFFSSFFFFGVTRFAHAVLVLPCCLSRVGALTVQGVVRLVRGVVLPGRGACGRRPAREVRHPCGICRHVPGVGSVIRYVRAPPPIGGPCTPYCIQSRRSEA